jgi:hypothetical protein
MHFMQFEQQQKTLMFRQSGVVARWQLLEMGFTERQIDRRVNLSRFIPLCRGIYTVPFTQPSWERTCVAAWLFGADRQYPAALSHVTAACFHGFYGFERKGTPQLIASRGDRHPNPLGMVSRRSDVRPDDIIEHSSGVSLTSPARTAVDLLMNDGRPGRAAETLRLILMSGKVTHAEIADRFLPMASQFRAGTAHVKPVLFPSKSLAAA